MNVSPLPARGAHIAVALTLCACSGNAAPPVGGTAVNGIALMTAARLPVITHRDLRKSWISSELARSKTPVLFVSDAGTADVYIYSLPSLQLLATITGFSQPQGLCADTKGNVWITDANAQIVYELSHKGYLENELTIYNGYPVGCAWDPTTGNLAVMNLFGALSGAGDVLVYPKGSGAPVQYTNKNQVYYYFGGYDSSGDLFFDGLDTSGHFILAKLAKGAKAPVTVNLKEREVQYPGMVQWVPAWRDNLIIGDQSCRGQYVSCYYKAELFGGVAYVKKRIYLDNYAGGSVCDMVQGVEYNNNLYGSDDDFCGYANSATYFWPYPGVSTPSAYNETVDSAPVGAAISL